MHEPTKTSNAESRPIKMRARPDLDFSPLTDQAGRTWVVKDPLAMNYVQLRDAEYSVLKMLDGRTTLRQVKQQLEQEYFPARISQLDVQQFLAKLHQSNLVVVDAFGQDAPLLERRRQQRNREWYSRCTNLLALRFRGVNPAPLLDRLYPLVRWAFSPAAFTAGLLLILAALLLVVVQFDTLVIELPTFSEFVAPRNLLLLAVAVMFAKGLHELAHGLTCRHFGGTCHELGVMLLVFTPCLYCNVSDAWTFPNKWHRIAVSLAGIYAELVLAAICTLLWWFSEPGLLHWICLDVMLLCSVSTLLVNGNPLLKYDGYYALGDWLGVPNLRQQSGQSLEQFVSSWVCGADAYSPRTLPLRGRWFLALYGTGAAVYRCFVIGIILVTIHAVLKSYQLESVAKVLAVFVVGGVVAASTWSMARMIRRMSMRPVNRTRAMLLVGSGLALLTSVLLVPLPARVRCPAQLWPVNARDIYVSIPGTLADQVTPGARVEQGQTIAKLSSLNLQQEVHDLRGKLNLQRIHVQHLQLRRASDSAAGNELPAAQEMLADFEEQLVERQADLKRLTIASPIDGIVLPPRTVAKDAAGPDELSRWHGRPLEPHNEGAFIETGTLLCYVGDPRQLEALLVIDETARERVRLGQQVRIQVALFAGTSLTGTIVELARGDPMTADRDSLSRPPLPLSELAEANRLDSAAYYARVELDNSDSDLCGVTGAATVAATPRSLGRRAIDYLSYTFRFRL